MTERKSDRDSVEFMSPGKQLFHTHSTYRPPPSPAPSWATIDLDEWDKREPSNQLPFPDYTGKGWGSPLSSSPQDVDGGECETSWYSSSSSSVDDESRYVSELSRQSSTSIHHDGFSDSLGKALGRLVTQTEDRNCQIAWSRLREGDENLKDAFKFELSSLDLELAHYHQRRIRYIIDRNDASRTWYCLVSELQEEKESLAGRRAAFPPGYFSACPEEIPYRQLARILVEEVFPEAGAAGRRQGTPHPAPQDVGSAARRIS